ncbi:MULTISPECIES: response regulator [Pseudomonas]|uniref:response regulator n=1 Tax=Pseudomonas TaxID=286 RepID=UPI00111285B7|nr:MULTISPECIES: response regulator [Pseudomonas]
MAMTSRVLIVDDDPVVRELLQAYLGEEGYDVLCAGTAEQAEASLAEAEQGGQPIDLVMLDIRLPGKDGLTLTRELRVRSEVGIILITGRNDDIDRIVGLECGADDYVIKPLNPRELVSRAKNLIRRVRHARQPNAICVPGARQHHKRFAQWTLDPDRRRLIDRDGSETPLTHGEFQLLGVFLRNTGHTLSRDQLMDQIRNREWLPNDRSIDVLVGRLRRKLRDDPAEPELIITIHGAGYLFTATPADT